MVIKFTKTSLDISTAHSSKQLLDWAAEILRDVSKTYHHCFLLKPQNIEASCDFIYSDKSKTNLNETSPPLALQLTVFLIAEKQFSLWLWNFQTFSFFFLTVLWKITRNCMTGLFSIPNLLKMGRKKYFF